MKKQNFTKHDVCGIWNQVAPLLPEEFTRLKESIKKHGVKQPIQVLDWSDAGQEETGILIDGFNRYTACSELGIHCPVNAISMSDDDLASFAIGLNAERRHLSPAQRAIAVKRCRDWKPYSRGKSSVTAMAKEASVARKTMHEYTAIDDAGLSSDILTGKITRETALERITPKKPQVKSPSEDPTVKLKEQIIQLQHENDDLQGQLLDQESMKRMIEDSKNPNTAVHARELSGAHARIREMTNKNHELQAKLVDREREIKTLRRKIKD